jgi:hypothetical protein
VSAACPEEWILILSWLEYCVRCRVLAALSHNQDQAVHCPDATREGGLGLGRAARLLIRSSHPKPHRFPI